MPETRWFKTTEIDDQGYQRPIWVRVEAVLAFADASTRFTSDGVGAYTTVVATTELFLVGGGLVTVVASPETVAGAVGADLDATG